MKGIVLAGRGRTRLYPITKGVSKQLLPIYDKQMIYYPLSVFLLADIQDILITSTPHDLPGFQRLLWDGSDYGVRLTYAEQPATDGLAQVFTIGIDFRSSYSAYLVIGDNIFYGSVFFEILAQAVENTQQGYATVFGYHAFYPERYGIVEFDSDVHAVSFEEKTRKPQSNYAVVGPYFYSNKATNVAYNIKLSARGEYVITTINEQFLDDDVQLLGRGLAWLDTGTHDSLSEASTFIEVIEKQTEAKSGLSGNHCLRKGMDICRQNARTRLAND